MLSAFRRIFSKRNATRGTSSWESVGFQLVLVIPVCHNPSPEFLTYDHTHSFISPTTWPFEQRLVDLFVAVVINLQRPFL